MAKPKILLLSGYDAASHRYWRKLLQEKLTQFDWTQVSLADRHFAWRVRGSGFSLAFDYSEILNRDYDLLIVTSMVDLNSLRGFIPKLAQLPSLVYFHENQFVYPLSSKQTNEHNQSNLLNAQISSVYTALCADQLVFNSIYNQCSFLVGMEKLFKRLPDAMPVDLMTRLETRSIVLPVPITTIDSPRVTKHRPGQPIEILWNHRWEYDKQPQVFFDAIRLLKQSGQIFKLHVLGQSFRKVPECFALAEREFSQEIETFGFQSKPDYLKILNRADIVVSTALHDFQGLSLLEAISRGCTPIAPNRVAYPEYVINSNLYELADSPENEAKNLYHKLLNVIDIKQGCQLNNQPELDNYYCQTVLPQYEALFNDLIRLKPN